jgi:hypothetical protein
MGSEPGKPDKKAPAVTPAAAVGETRHVAVAAAFRANESEDTLPADSAPGDGWTVAADAEPRSSARIDRYQFGPEIGRGGMGRVVEATDVRLGRKVAVKEALPRGLDLRRRFEREVRITARLEHPSIVPLYDAGTSADGNPFYVMRKVSGRPLDRLIADARTLDERITLLPHLLAAIDAIAHAHRRDVVHRDMKPANVLVGEHGETVVIDWGLAKAMGEDDDDDPVDAQLAPSDAVETQIGAVFGTPGFMAPEQARGEPLDPRSDVYALGATMYQLLSGRPPHTGTTATEVIDRALGERPPPLEQLVPGVPPELVTITDKAMAFDREHRYADASAFAADVRAFLAGRLVGAHRYTAGQRVMRFVRRHRAAVAIAVVAAVAIAAGSVLGIHGILTERDRAMRAEQRAVAGQRAAEEARDRERDRADELLVTQARSLVDVNPTAALAALKLVSPRSPRLRNARMVAISAAARGAAWGYPGHGRVTSTLELAPDGARLLTAGESHGFRILDLDRHEEVLAVDFPERIRAIWVARGDAVLVAPASGGLVQFDARSGARTPLPFTAEVAELQAVGSGDRALVVDEAGLVYLLEVRTGALTLVPLPVPADPADGAHRLRQIVISPNGLWLMAASQRHTLVARLDGTVLAEQPFSASSMVIAADGRTGALVMDGRTAKIVVDGDKAALTWIDPPPTKDTRFYPGQVLFRGDMLLIVRFGDRVDFVDENGVVREWIPRQKEAITNGAEARGNVVAFVDMGGHLVLVSPQEIRTVRAPSEMQLRRVVARPDSRFIAVSAENVTLVWDLDRMMPATLTVEDTQTTVFRDDNTLFVTPHFGPWEMLDVRSGKGTPIQTGLDMNNVVALVVSPDGRMLVRTMGADALLLVRRGSTRAERVVDGNRARAAALLSSDRFAFTSEAGEVYFGSSASDLRVVHQEPGPVDRILPSGDGALLETRAGALVRLDGTGRELARVDVPDLNGGAIAADDSGRFVFGVGDKVVAWNGARLEDIVSLDSRVEGVYATPAGMVAYTKAGFTYLVGADRQARRLLAQTMGGVYLAETGSMLLAMLSDRRLVVADLVSGERAVLPPMGLVAMPSISPDGRRVAFFTVGGGMTLWTFDAPLDTEPDAWQPWLEDTTNAVPSTQPDVVWPWQVK